MSATYNPAEPTTRDVIRGLLQDTTLTDARLQDETIDARIVRLGADEAAAQCALSIAAFYAQDVQRYSEAGGIGVGFATDRVKFYENLAADIRANGLEGARDRSLEIAATTILATEVATHQKYGVWPLPVT